MAGSKKWMVYTADAGDKYAVQIDESNGEAADFEDFSVLFQLQGATLPPLPRGMTMRYANTATNSNDGGSRKVWVGSPTSDIVSGLVASILLPYFGADEVSAAISYAIGSIVGERVRGRPKTADTGILDGDAS